MFGSNNKLDIGFLAGIDFFAGFTDEELAKVAALGERHAVDAGTVFIDQGRIGDACFVIVEGRAAISASGRFVTAVGPGTMTGEMALVDHRPRTASVTAETPMVLVRFGTKEFRTLLDQIPTAREQTLALLEQRMAENQARAE